MSRRSSLLASISENLLTQVAEWLANPQSGRSALSVIRNLFRAPDRLPCMSPADGQKLIAKKS
jgi:proline dehydrogenase